MIQKTLYQGRKTKHHQYRHAQKRDGIRIGSADPPFHKEKKNHNAQIGEGGGIGRSLIPESRNKQQVGTDIDHCTQHHPCGAIHCLSGGIFNFRQNTSQKIEKPAQTQRNDQDISHSVLLSKEDQTKFPARTHDSKDCHHKQTDIAYHFFPDLLILAGGEMGHKDSDPHILQ